MTREIRVLDVARPDRITLTIQGGDNQSPAWMDNRRLTFGSNRDGLQKIYVVSVDGKGLQHRSLPRTQLPRVILQAGRGRRVCWAFTR